MLWLGTGLVFVGNGGVVLRAYLESVFGWMKGGLMECYIRWGRT